VVAVLSANPPGTPEGAALLLFGGRAAGVSNADLWSFGVADRKWARLDAQGPEPRFGHNAFFDFTRNRLVVALGQNETTFYSDVWAYDVAAAAWQQLDAASAERPRVRYGAGGAYDAVGDRILISHGFADQGRFDDTWAFDFKANQWTQVATTGAVPIKRCLHRTLWVPQRGEMLLFGGQTDTNPFLGDFWSLDPAAGVWTERTPAGLPGPRNLTGAALSADGSTWYLAGGNTPEGPSRETWAYDLASDEWSLVEAGELPARYSADAAIAGEALYVFGGHDGSGELGDLWSLPL
jgi:N-acetylneuraminic acid mutarotase